MPRMCGRYALYETDELSERFGFDDHEFDEVRSDIKQRYNVAPEQVMPVIVAGEDGRHLELMQWGFMPVWAKDERDIFKYKTFNARSEGIFDKVTWKYAIRNSRCLIPANGFYEWRDTAGGKQPYFIHPADEDIFAFAGIYRNWRNKDGIEFGTYSIITTAANQQMEAIHNRMPVILHRSSEGAWIDPANDSQEGLEALMAPYTDGQLDLYPVSKNVNTSRVDSNTLVLPLNSK